MRAYLEVPVDGQTTVLVEVDQADIPGELALAAPRPGVAIAKASKSLVSSLEQLESVLHAIRQTMVAAAPKEYTVELGVTLGGETGLILAKGTAEATLKVTMTWKPDKP